MDTPPFFERTNLVNLAILRELFLGTENGTSQRRHHLQPNLNALLQCNRGLLSFSKTQRPEYFNKEKNNLSIASCLDAAEHF